MTETPAGPQPAADERSPEELARENEQLKREIERLQRQRSYFGSLLLKASSLVALGPGLSNALRAWFAAIASRKQIPVNESADVVAAVVSRWLKTLVLTAVIAALPTGLLVWQNNIMRDQLYVLALAHLAGSNRT